jgi:hypothetical protein
VIVQERCRVEAPRDALHFDRAYEIRVHELYRLLRPLGGRVLGRPWLLGLDTDLTVLRGGAFPVSVYLALCLPARVAETLAQQLLGNVRVRLVVGESALHFVEAFDHSRPQDDLPWTWLVSPRTPGSAARQNSQRLLTLMQRKGWR